MKKSKKPTAKPNKVKRYAPKRADSPYEAEYLPADEEVVFHEGLDGLDVIRIKLPKPPPLKTIEGYGLPPKQQKFKFTDWPPKLKMLNDKGYVDVEDYWKEIEEDYAYFKDELWFIEREWFRRKFGHWVFIKGKPTWIPPWHYMQLNYQDFVNELDGTNRMEYRDRDRKLYVGRWYAATTTEAPFKYKAVKGDRTKFTSSDRYIMELEEKGWAVEKKGYMVDMGTRTAVGTVEFKSRRSGYTYQCVNIGTEIVTRMSKALFGMQSMTEDNAERIFQKQIVQSYKGYPFFFRPIYDNIVDAKRTMRFMPAVKKSATNLKKSRVIKSLYSEITYGSSTVGYFDSQKLKYYLGDEFGKCLRYDTPIKMADGSTKMVQDVKEGDMVMGGDGNPKRAYGVTTGRERMYEIIPNKGMSWGCNASHILSLKWCRSDRTDRWQKNQVVNICVADYLNLPKSVQKHLMLYRANGCNYAEKPVPIDPYMLGLWLGDGSVNAPAITAADQEIREYIKKWAHAFGLDYSEREVENNKALSIYFKKKESKYNKFLDALSDLGIRHEKQIPATYLFNSRENRLKLLAGLIDTDGTKCQRKNINQLSIIQKSETFAKQIHQLVIDLGFHASIKVRKAGFKRENGTRFDGRYYLVDIFGNNLDEIPVLVERKRPNKITDPHKNRRNPMHTGFRVEDRGEGDYYGFAVDGDGLFLLGDNTVTHNTKEVDVLERALVVRKTLTTGDNKIIRGYSNHISTAGELKTGGGASAKKLAQLSHWGKRNDIGQTDTAYINLFIPSDEGLEGFVDEWGGSMKEQAREHIMAKRRSLIEKEAWEQLNEEIRQTPLEWKENFISNNKQAKFNVYILEKRLSDLTVGVNPYVFHGKFAWEKNSTHNYNIKKLPTRRDFLTKKDKVIFIPQPSHDFDWELSYMPPIKDQNSVIYNEDTNALMPGNVLKFAHGIDVFKYGQKTTAGSGSFGAGAIFRLPDPMVDLPHLDPLGINPKTGDTNHVTGRFCGVYMKRPDLEEFLEQQLMAALFFGMKSFPEMNLKDYFRWAKDREFEEYLFYEVDAISGQEKREPGAHTQTTVINTIFNAYAQHINQNGLREVHPLILQQCLEIDDSMNDYDAFTAGGYALMQAGSIHRIEIEEDDTFDAGQVFQFETF